MEKQIKFNESDKDLIKAITEYQKEQGISSFVGAVRKLCQDALVIKKVMK